MPRIEEKEHLRVVSGAPWGTIHYYDPRKKAWVKIERYEEAREYARLNGYLGGIRIEYSIQELKK